MRIVASDIDRSQPQLRFKFNIKNMQNCLGFVESCPEHIREAFSESDAGCGRNCGRLNYEFKGKKIFMCGCYTPNFTCNPKPEDIPYYMKCFKLGN